MKWNIQIAVGMVAVCSLVLKPGLHGQDEADHEALRKIKAAYEDAIKSNDLKKMAPYLGQGVSGVMLTGEEVKGLEGLQAYWDKIKAMMGPGGQYEVTLKPEKSELFGDIALARGSTEDLVRTGAGKTYHFSSLWTAICRKDNGQWKVIRMQGTMDPIANPFVNARVQFTRMAYGIGGLVLGVILVVVTRLARRKAAA